jgi:hypothetical protein
MIIKQIRAYRWALALWSVEDLILKVRGQVRQ